MTFQAQQEYRFCTFYLGQERYAVDILAVREITRGLQVTPARGSLSCIKGLLNLRGQIVTVISPAAVLGLSQEEQSAESRLLVLKTNSELEARQIHHHETSEDLISLWCDRISDVVAVMGTEIKTPAAAAAGVASPETLDGVIEVESQLVRILNPERLLEAAAGVC